MVYMLGKKRNDGDALTVVSSVCSCC
jgi:hypothetical protein